MHLGIILCFVYLWQGEYTQVSADAWGVQKRTPEPTEMEAQTVVRHPRWELGHKASLLQESAHSSSWPISPAPNDNILIIAGMSKWFFSLLLLFITFYTLFSKIYQINQLTQHQLLGDCMAYFSPWYDKSNLKKEGFTVGKDPVHHSRQGMAARVWDMGQPLTQHPQSGKRARWIPVLSAPPFLIFSINPGLALL